MSVIEKDKIDGIGKSKSNKELLFLITDHLDWSDERYHLVTLQDKINSYVLYIESEQFKEIYPDDEFDFFTIEIHFKYPIIEKCSQFLDVVAKQLGQYGIKISAQTN